MTMFSSLTNRIFLASALLAVLSIGAAVLVVNAAVTEQAEAELGRGLEEAAAIVDEFRTTLFDHFTTEARLIADLPVLKAAVYETDRATVQPIAESYQRQLKADLLLVTRRDGEVLAQAAGPGVPLSGLSARPAVTEARAGEETTWFLPYRGGVLQIVSVPILIGEAPPEVLGSLSVGSSLDQSVAERLKRLTNSEIAFVVEGRIEASTLPELDDRVLPGLLDASAIRSITLGGNEYVGVVRPLSVHQPVAAGGGGAIVLRSRTERLRFLRALHTKLGATALVAVLAATLLSYLIARTVTRPLDAITATMRETASTGDLTRRIPVAQTTTWQDEDARLLATTFNSMTEAIARFQQQEAQRERLSSLGRLSTVIAHEVRNPLMIIKASLRALNRPDAAPAERQAVADIDGEILRLNRLVSEVLDFARPIAFELGPVDLNALCRSAAGAAEADGGEPRVRLDLSADIPVVTADGERLRLAIVNVLSNARHAVQTTATPDPDGRRRPGSVSLATRQTGDRVSIRVRDDGPGIAPADLARIFDPFFTTKRTGTGLGLAIAKNVVEGLGGIVVVDSRPGFGTEIRFDLPLGPPPGAAARTV
jgi:signal transduction histidine kinase/uncharacterized membrane-anchored protein YhcB (DUF1043 family)